MPVNLKTFAKYRRLNRVSLIYTEKTVRSLTYFYKKCILFHYCLKLLNILHTREQRPSKRNVVAKFLGSK